ncbi:L-aminoadipate-semialdehyde dehydrogenase [Mycena albidolilacea]|uniref:L-aminoadipate-semialdehyde dehydrogenase n=1 Tax=Mycena albidolilacea TaxID=1033008 RepID=A0AAD7EWB4_9AGAR|nr:L-aminoadipate-semialdehyde dehydrogenase [Mycena albidolilacea]
MPVPLYKAKSLTQLLAIRAHEQPDYPAVHTGIPEEDNSVVLRTLTYSQVQKAVDRLAWHYSALGLTPRVQPGELPPPRVIAVFTTSAIDESFLELALAKLGLAALLLSVNNSVPAVAHLCRLTNSTHLIYSEKFTKEAQEAQAILKSQDYDLTLVPDKRFPLWGEGGVDSAKFNPFPAILTPEQEKDRPAVILHSSGSTGFPKPVFVTHYGLVANIAINQNKPGFSTLPVYHGYGHFAIFRCMYSTQPITLFPPHLPLTSANICAVLKASPPVKQCFAVPYVIKLLGETPEGVTALASFDLVGYAGAAVPDDLGTRLVAAGVNLFSIYGTTETGGLLNSERDMTTDKDWNWLRAKGMILDYLVMEPRGDNTFEAVVKDGYPPKIESNRPDGSYATKDLFLRHPERNNWYKYIGRLDDTLVQTLGEKTNPVPIELAIRGNSPYVAEAIVFGAGKPQTGCLILPSDLAKDLSNAEIMEKIWPVVEQANAQAPTHSRILPEMIEILPYGTQIPIATKMSILRPACYTKFKDIIEGVYARFEQEGDEGSKLRLEKSELEQFILNAIVKALGPVKSVNLDSKVDLFAFGVDSLQGTRIRNVFQKDLFLSGNILGQNVVYEHPSVEKLADHILSLQAGGASQTDGDQHEAQMLAMVERWVNKVQVHKPSASTTKRPEDARVVVLTGATGSLGAHILNQLVSSPSVRKVICLSRAKSHADSVQRITESMKTRKVPLPGNKLVSYAANPNAPLLGLTESEYNAIRDEVTDVIHNAWPVNFVLSLQSYDEHIGGAVNLINLCLGSPYAEPAAFFFSSSISCRQGAPELTCAEDFSPAPSTAVGTGYARSKWVVEKLCQRAAAVSGVPVGVLRIGQMVGDSVTGVWNETEAWPLMFKSANTFGALPTTDEHPSWLPVDYAGKGIVEVLASHPTKSAIVYHIVNPNVSASWDDILAGLRTAGLEFETVDRTQWVERLSKSDPDGQKNPTIKLLPFFQMRYGKAHRQPMVFSTEATAKAAPSIGASPPVSPDLVAKWVLHWRETGFLV